MAAAGYTYGIEGVSKSSTAANFVINQGSDAKVLVEVLDPSGNISIAAPAIVLQGLTLATEIVAGQLTVPDILTNSLYLRGVSVASAAAVTIDFASASVLAGFPPGAYCYFECGDGAGSSVTGFLLVGVGSVLGAPVKNNGALVAPVTDVAVTVATSVLSISFTGKAASTNGYIRLTRCQV